ncbi:MAG: alpha-glucosidase [Clostridiales bacterium]|nr:alpha-glucosidase [Clostridiales bacterium]
MPQFRHLFSCVERSSGHSLYRTEGTLSRVDFLSESLLRVAILPDGVRLLPTLSVYPAGGMPREGRDRLSLDGFPLFSPEREGDFAFVWGEYRLSFEPVNFLMRLTKNGLPLLSDRAPMGHNLGGEYGEYARHYLAREPGERIYGLGDKSGALNKAGRRFRLDSADAMGYDAETSDPLYQHVPFYICQNGAGFVGLFYDTHAGCVFDFGKELSNYTGAYRYTKIGERALVYYILLGTLPEIVARFSSLTGGSAFLPRRALLFSGSTMTYTDAPDADRQLRAFADECGARGFACGGFYLSSGYTSIGQKRYVFHWNNEKIPNPKALAAYFRARGIELVANIKPVFLTDHPLYETIARRSWFLHLPDGTPALTPFWDGLGSWLDFTNPGAYDFWKEQVISQLLANGIAGTWNDNNEYEVLDCGVLADGFGNPYPACLEKPAFAMRMAAASLEAQQSFFGADRRQFLSSRAGAAGICRMAMVWTGDNRTEWKTLRYNHYMGLTLSLSGLYLFGHDIGGFVGLAPERELFLRWLQHGAFTPRFVIHSWNDDARATTPWFYEDLVPAVREIFAFRYRMLPYLYDAMYRAHTLHEPILRPLVYEDPAADPESDLFFVGDSLLAVCVFDQGVSELTLRLPKSGDGWYDERGAWLPGGETITLACPAQGAPHALHKGGSVFAEDAAPNPGVDEIEPVFTIYAQESGSFSRGYFFDDGETTAYLQNDCTQIAFSISCLPDCVRVRYENRGNRAIRPNVRLIDRLHRPLDLVKGDDP